MIDVMNTSIFTNPMTDDVRAAPIRSLTPVRRLRRVLRTDSVVSFTSGLLLALAPTRVDDLLATGHPGWIRLVGIGFLLFAADVFLLSRADDERLRRWTPAVIAANTAYVVASVVTVLLGWYSAAGAVAVLAAAVMVDTLAVLQWRGWRQLTTR
jgi:hypothetical protein